MIYLYLLCLPYWFYVLYFKDETERLAEVYWLACVRPGEEFHDKEKAG
jgi:hypothetical protein